MVQVLKNHTFFKATVAMLAAVFLSLFIVGQSFAAESATTNATLKVNSGILSIATDKPETAFPDMTLSGLAQDTTNEDMGNLTVTDATGTGNGWTVQAEATQMASADHSLAAGSLTLNGLVSVNPDGTDSPVPALNPDAQLVDMGSVINLASAAVNEGMGKYTSEVGDLKLHFPSNGYIGDYQTTLTYHIVSGPVEADGGEEEPPAGIE